MDQVNMKLFEIPPTRPRLSYKRASLNVGLWLLCFLPAILFDAELRWFWLFYWFMGLFFGSALYFMPPVLERKAIEVYNELIQKMGPHQEQLADQYYSDTKKWLDGIFRSSPTKNKVKFLELCLIALPYAIFFLHGEAAHWLSLSETEINQLLFSGVHIVFTSFGLIGFTWLFYWLYHLYRMFQGCASILHHYSFWPHVQNLPALGPKNSLGEFFAIHMLFWVTVIVVFGNFFIGIVVGLSGWIFSNINPRHNYYSKIDRKYQAAIILVFVAIIGAAIVSMFRNLAEQSPVLPIIVQFLTAGLFLIILFRLFFLTGPPFNISTVRSLWQRMSAKLHIPDKWGILIINTSPFLLYLGVKLIYQPLVLLFRDEPFGFDLIGQSPEATVNFVIMLICGLILMMVSVVGISWQFLEIQREIREIAALSVVLVKQDKMEEHHFHFWELFASPLTPLFSITMGGLFILIMHTVYINLDLTRNGLELFIPIYGMMFIFGSYQGVLTWQTVNGIHYLWHIQAIKKPEYPNNPNKERNAYIRRFQDAFDRIRGLYFRTFLLNGIGFIGVILVTENNWMVAILIGCIFGLGLAYLIHRIWKSLFSIRPE